jgi:hypothetical protein
MVLPGKARQGKARQGKARQGKARQGKARQGKARQGKARQGKARQYSHLYSILMLANAEVNTFYHGKVGTTILKL